MRLKKYAKLKLRSRQPIRLPVQTADLAGSVVAVDDTLRSGFLENRFRSGQAGRRFSPVVGFQRVADVFDRGLGAGLVTFVA
jgi:hypothetical protein